jgi:glycerol-3-phosphate dehydrogenase
MPIVFTVNEIVKNNISPNDAAVMLMTRDKKSEDI